VEKTFRLLLLLACPLGAGAGFVARDLLRLVYGVTFEPATPVLSVLVWAGALAFLNFLFIFAFTSLNHQREVTRIAGVGLGVNLLLTPLLAAWAGGVGAAAALVAAEASVTLLASVRLRRLLPDLRLWGIAPKALGASAIMALALRVLGPGPLSVQLLVAVLIYAGGLALLRTVSRDELSLYYRALVRREG
jgi:O-antigen/teichoic acid export membrane protein